MNSGEERSGVRDSVTQQDFSVLGHIGDSQGELHLGVWILAAQGDNVRISGLLWLSAKRKHTQPGETVPPSTLEGSRTDSAVVSFPEAAWKPSVQSLRFPASPFQQSHDHLNTSFKPFLSDFNRVSCRPRQQPLSLSRVCLVFS